MSINLNSEEYDASEGVAVFNDGKAGVAENVAVSLEKKKPEDKENAPDYKIVFTDEKGGTCNYPLWYVEKKTDYKSVEELIKKQGKVLKHLAHAILGQDFQFPEFKNAKEMLDGAMKAIKGGLKKGLKFRVFVNYGAGDYAKKYIQPRTWVPFLEPMSVDIEETRLKQGNLDVMSRLEPDNDSSGSTSDSMSDGVDDDEDDW